ncbi:MAG: hypothetical protein DYG94_01780 [Leptolyngbya sp. PLA3]|nr:MAG: hypothetical protein EDM82_00105 [Cyanobacteria bacterium CYA]MCE7967462.1 hypothetical protein [Leptolyngbya sp. PL-A3]
MPGWLIGLLVVGGIVLEFGVIVLVLRGLMRSSLGRLSDQFPFTEPEAGAVRRNFQSFSIGLVNAGYSIHVAVDDHSLHLMPAAILRWCGVRACSVPWSEVRVLKRVGSYRKARIGGVNLYGPGWCLDLASPDEA